MLSSEIVVSATLSPENGWNNSAHHFYNTVQIASEECAEHSSFCLIGGSFGEMMCENTCARMVSARPKRLYIQTLRDRLLLKRREIQSTQEAREAVKNIVCNIRILDWLLAYFQTSDKVPNCFLTHSSFVWAAFCFFKPLVVEVA